MQLVPTKGTSLGLAPRAKSSKCAPPRLEVRRQKSSINMHSRFFKKNPSISRNRGTSLRTPLLPRPEAKRGSQREMKRMRECLFFSADIVLVLIAHYSRNCFDLPHIHPPLLLVSLNATRRLCRLLSPTAKIGRDLSRPR